MHARTTSLALLSLVFLIGGAAEPQSHLMRYADVHGDKIVFTYEGDLWLASSKGGDAQRITRDPGSEFLAKFSPDGKQIAFTAQYDGGMDVYVMDLPAGSPRRLTFHPAADFVLGWFPDGKHVLFRSTRTWPRRGQEIYKVSVDGGMPERLPVDRAGLTSLSPDAKRIAYNRISREARTWKRHKGGTAQDIWMGSLADGDFRRITDWPGTDNFPMWHGNDIYFTSDRLNDTLNIFKYDVVSGKVTAVTNYSDYDVKYPSLGPKQIIFQNGESLHLLDLDSGKVTEVPMHIPTDHVRMRPELVDVHPDKGVFRLSPGGERMLIEARGEIVSVPVEEGETINVTHQPASREKYGVWSPDGKWIAFVSDKTGEEEIYLVDQWGEKPWRQLTSDSKGFLLPLVWSPDSNHLLYSDKFMRLNLVDVDSGEKTVIDKSDYDDAWERWGIQDYVWSPDSKWIAYTKMERTINEAIFLYSMETGQTHRVTGEMTTDFSPSFDPKGRYLYFLSHRSLSPVMGFIDQNYVFLDVAKPYMVVLEEGKESPFRPEESVVKPDEKDKAADADSNGQKEVKADADKSESKKNEGTVVNLDGIDRRVIAVEGVPAGNYFRLVATDDGFLYLKRPENEFEKYQNVNDETGGKLDLYGYKLKDKETKKLIDGIANYHLSPNGKKLVYRSGSKYGVVDTGKEAKVGDGSVSLDDVHIPVDRALEFAQIFNEAWRVQRDWFYDANLHGVDWKAMGEKYRKFVPFAGNRQDLNYLIGEMIGELNAGHTYVWGGDIEDDSKDVSVGLLGVTFATDPGARYYRIAHIVPGTPGDPNERSPFDEPGCPIREGQYLIAIDGQEVTTDDNPYAHLQDKAGRMVRISYNDQPSAEGARIWRAKTLRREWSILYREWVNNNRAYVDKVSNGQIGYVHIPDMGANGLVEFSSTYFPQYYKKGMIIDERYNGGGFTSDMIIDRLERRMWGVTKPREGKPLHEPERVFYGHMAVVINADTGSSGEMFAEAIKRKGIAPLIGMRTWGGSVGIEPHEDFVDHGVTTPPQFGLYGLDRTWLIEGHGVDPDIQVENKPGDVLKGNDAQLEKTIDLLMKEIQQDPKDVPAPPPYPNKSKKVTAS